MYVSTMPEYSNASDEEKRDTLETILKLSRGSRTEAFQYLEDSKGLGPDVVQMGVSALEHLVNG